MTVELNRNSLHTYRISPADPLLVERRENKHGARWEEVRRCQSRGQANSALRTLSHGGTLREVEERPALPEKPAINYYQQSKYAALRYDYRQVDEQHREQVQAAAVEISSRLKRTVEDAITIGERLLSVKDILPHGQFSDWWQTEFDLGERTIQEMMNMARRFAGKSAIIALLNQTTVRLLSAPSVPESAIEEAFALAQSQDEPLRVEQVKAIRDAHKPPRPPKPPATIEAEYVVMEPEPADPFGAWLAACPANLTLRQRHDIIELAKRVAVDARGEEPKLYNAVTNALPMWSQLIITMEKMLKN
jgi:hypothetical protein